MARHSQGCTFKMFYRKGRQITNSWKLGRRRHEGRYAQDHSRHSHISAGESSGKANQQNHQVLLKSRAVIQEIPVISWVNKRIKRKRLLFSDMLRYFFCKTWYYHQIYIFTPHIICKQNLISNIRFLHDNLFYHWTYAILYSLFCAKCSKNKKLKKRILCCIIAEQMSVTGFM